MMGIRGVQVEEDVSNRKQSSKVLTPSVPPYTTKKSPPAVTILCWYLGHGAVPLVSSFDHAILLMLRQWTQLEGPLGVKPPNRKRLVLITMVRWNAVGGMRSP